MDNVTPSRRSEVMARVRSKDTGPEMAVRRLLHAAGYRYRLHVAGLPGKPDLVFIRRRKAVFVHGCFWHRHEHCNLARLPKSRVDFWLNKLEKNRQRDLMNLEALNERGWKTLVIWECELRDKIALESRLRQFLDETAFQSS